MPPLRCETLAALIQIFVRSIPRLQPSRPPRWLVAPPGYKVFYSNTARDILSPQGRAIQAALRVENYARNVSRTYPWRPAGHRGCLRRPKSPDAMSVDSVILSAPSSPPAPPSPRLPAVEPRAESVSTLPRPPSPPPQPVIAEVVDDGVGPAWRPHVSALIDSPLPQGVLPHTSPEPPSDGFTPVTRSNRTSHTPLATTAFHPHNYSLNLIPGLLPTQCCNALCRGRWFSNGCINHCAIHSALSCLASGAQQFVCDNFPDRPFPSAIGGARFVLHPLSPESPTTHCHPQCQQCWFTNGRMMYCASHSNFSRLSYGAQRFIIDTFPDLHRSRASRGRSLRDLSHS